jgi:hypothetical protein
MPSDAEGAAILRRSRETDRQTPITAGDGGIRDGKMSQENVR